MGMGNLAKMAQQMQADMARAQQELEELRVEGSAGGGVVKATVSGKLDIVSVSIDPRSSTLTTLTTCRTWWWRQSPMRRPMPRPRPRRR